MLSCLSALEFRSFPKTAKLPKKNDQDMFAAYLDIIALLFIPF